MGESDPLIVTQIDTPPLFGVGLIDQLSLSDMQAAIAPEPRMWLGDRPRFFRKRPGNEVGRFGWKGQFARLDDFVAAACAMELGLTNPRKSQPVPGHYRESVNAKPDMTEEQLAAMVAFCRNLPRPQQVYPESEPALKQVLRGQYVFEMIGCASCHPRTVGSIDGIYSDFRLHTVEASKDPSLRHYYFSSESDGFTRVSPGEWQTPPLWGVADSGPYFHDGKSKTLRDAIERHSLAGSATGAFAGLSQDDKSSVIAFLKSLRAPGIGEPSKVPEPYKQLEVAPFSLTKTVATIGVPLP